MDDFRRKVIEYWSIGTGWRGELELECGHIIAYTPRKFNIPKKAKCYYCSGEEDSKCFNKEPK